ncbi:MAG: imelysin family protein [Rhodospirillales bacterium]
MRWGFAAALTLCLVLPAKAAPEVETAVARVIQEAILPGYDAFAQAAGRQIPAVESLCAAPSREALAKARDAFAETVAAWSRVELYRFGPARQDYRFEKLFYWPDRKGRGLKQVQATLAKEDPTAAQAASLAGKSVAVQGLPALEYVLFGRGSESLAQGSAFRCSYARSLAGVVSRHADALLAAWVGEAGFARVLLNAGSEASPYRTQGEVLQELLRAASEQLQILRDLKIANSLGKTVEKAKPKRAPFWRSDLTLANLSGNVAGVRSLMEGGLSALLPEAEARHARGLAFELTQVETTLAALAGEEAAWRDLATSVESRQKLTYVTLPLTGAIEVIAERYPAALGLTLGFNSLDGD